MTYKTALSRLFPQALTLKAVAAEAAAHGLTARREPGDGYTAAASRLFEVYPKGDSSLALYAESLPELAAQVAAYAEALKAGGVAFHAPVTATRAAALIRAALTLAGVTGAEVGDYEAARNMTADPETLAVTFGAFIGGQYAESIGTPRALSLWASVGGLIFREMLDSDESESLAVRAEGLAGRVAAELSGRLARASSFSMGAGDGGHAAAEKLARAAEAGVLPSPRVLAIYDAEGAAHAAFRAAELAEYRPTPAARVALLDFAEMAYRRAAADTAGHGKRDRLRELAARCGSAMIKAEKEAAGAVDPAEGMDMGVERVTESGPVTIGAAVMEPDPEPAAQISGRAAELESKGDWAQSSGPGHYAEAVAAFREAADLSRAAGYQKAADRLTLKADNLAPRVPVRLTLKGRPAPEAGPLNDLRAAVAKAPEALPRSVDVTPTWAGLLPALLAVLDNGTAEGSRMARAELARMAAAADSAVADQKARAAAELGESELAAMMERAAAELGESELAAMMERAAAGNKADAALVESGGLPAFSPEESGTAGPLGRSN